MDQRTLIMKYMRNEKLEIQTHIANSMHEGTLIDINTLSIDDPEKRIPYLDKRNE